VSLIGVDLGTSAIKVTAYTTDGRQLAQARESVPGAHPAPGHWEVDVRRSREAFRRALRSVATHPAVVADPPTALSFSSSGREVFPVSEQGDPIGPCLMTADTRGDEVAARTAARRSPEEWFRIAGHVPRRMDPINRALWWRETAPDVTGRTRWFMNWHEFFALELTGRPVVDWSDAGTWATYDAATGDWSGERVAETGIDPRWLPDIQPNAMPIGPVLPEMARELGLPSGLMVVTGAYDTFAASVGSAAVDPGVVSLSCGTWHSYNMAVDPGWPVTLVHEGLSVYPHPGPTGFGIVSTDPNGMSVIDWARELTHLGIEDLDAGLTTASDGPGHVYADAAFTPLPHQVAGEGFGGRFSGVTLATSAVDLVRALMEGIALRFSISLASLRQRGIDSHVIRATGGGSRSAWWLQLMADVTGTPVEVVALEEPGTFGAAILAGVGTGIYASVSDACERLVTLSHRYAPDTARGDRYASVRARIQAEGG
jgi:sugar (pentulose or hexulose) kinase